MPEIQMNFLTEIKVNNAQYLIVELSQVFGQPDRMTFLMASG
jgi:hypothetical protein